MALVNGSIHDDVLRFLLLTPEQQDWCDKCVNKMQSILVPLTTENEAIARDIAQIFPIRLRYYSEDRFGNLMPTVKEVAKFFRVRCRFAETWQDLATVDPEDLARNLVDVQPMTAPTGKIFGKIFTIGAPK